MFQQRRKEFFAARIKRLLFSKPTLSNMNFDVFGKEQQQYILRI